MLLIDIFNIIKKLKKNNFVTYVILYLLFIAFNMSTSEEKKIMDLFPEPSTIETTMMWCHLLNEKSMKEGLDTYYNAEQKEGKAKAVLLKMKNLSQFSLLVFWGFGKEPKKFLFTRDWTSDTPPPSPSSPPPKIFATYYNTTKVSPKILLETPLFKINKKQSFGTIEEYIHSV